MKWSLPALAIAIAAPPAAAQQVTPLFASDEPVAITLTGPMNSFQQDRSDTPRPATLSVGGEQLPLTLAPRGITRRMTEICQFPPLRLRFPQPPTAGLFAGQRSLKLVTHCRTNENFQQYVLLEYAAYRLLNTLTPAGLRVRLASIDYRLPSGRSMVQRTGFIIEDLDDAARRAGLTRPQVGDAVARSQLSPPDAARAALFAYMIGNLDWSMRAGPEGEGCCHNFRLFARPGTRGFVPIPYDFDFSGLVDAPYAVPPAELQVPSVRRRLYRGYCMHNAEAVAAAAEFRAKRPELMAVLASIPGLKEGSRSKAAAYLEGFFSDIADDERVRSRVLRTCVR